MSVNETRKNIIENYIAAYNRFDIEGMLKDMDERVVFRNISNGTVDLTTSGVAELRAQAEQAKNLFSEREQKITGMKFNDDEIEVEIAYRGTLAVDLPNGLKAGDPLELNGKSIFRFAGEKIVELEDVS